MNKNMFCFQCEQSAGCTGCTGMAGVCGKSAEVAALQDELTGALIGLARATNGGKKFSKSTQHLLIKGLFSTVTNVNFNSASLQQLIGEVRLEKQRLIPRCASCNAPCEKNSDYDLQQLWSANEDIRSLKSLILFGIRGMAAYAYHAMVLGSENKAINLFFAKALFFLR